MNLAEEVIELCEEVVDTSYLPKPCKPGDKRPWCKYFYSGFLPTGGRHRGDHDHDHMGPKSQAPHWQSAPAASGGSHMVGAAPGGASGGTGSSGGSK